jgi:hypothetical protein
MLTFSPGVLLARLGVAPQGIYIPTHSPHASALPSLQLALAGGIRMLAPPGFMGLRNIHRMNGLVATGGVSGLLLFFSR